MKSIERIRVATVAMNVKGADLLFLDHQDTDELDDHDHRMWQAARVDVSQQPFGRVIVYVPLLDDGVNRNSLRSNPRADIPGYSETREFALGIRDLWPYIGLFFDKLSSPASNLLAEVHEHFLDQDDERGFTYAHVMRLFEDGLRQDAADRPEVFHGVHVGTLRSVYQHLRGLGATLGGLIDATGTGYGLETLADLRPYDMVVVDIERIMTNPRDPGVAENAIRVITAYVLTRLTEAMTRGTVPVDHIIVFADELNRLAPRQGDGGIGDQLAQLARTTRAYRGIVLFGAGQFRSGINEDILKAASVHYSMQTPEYELTDRLYNGLSTETKARLAQLRPGQTLLQYPSLRTAVFARFPRPFVFTGATKWRRDLAPIPPRPLADCIRERLCRLDPLHLPQQEEVRQLLDGILAGAGRNQRILQDDIVGILRAIEMDWATDHRPANQTPWQAFSVLVLERLGQRNQADDGAGIPPTPPGFVNNEEGWDD